MLRSLCCTNSKFLNSCCGLCSVKLGLSLSQQIKLFYFIATFFFVLICLVVKLLLKQPSPYILESTRCNDLVVNHEDISSLVVECVYDHITTIIMFSVGIVYLLIAFSTVSKSEKAKITNEGLWLMKLIMVGLAIGVLILTGSFASGWMYQTALAAWLVQQCLQSIVIIDLIYSAGIAIKERIEEENSRLLKLTEKFFFLLFFAGTITLNVLSYTRYQVPYWISVTNSVAIGLLFVAALVNISKHNNMFVYGAICLFIQLQTFLLHKNIKSNLLEEGRDPISSLILLWLTGFMFLGMLTRGSGRIRTRKSSINEKFGLVSRSSDEEGGYLTSYEWPKFHTIMVLVALSLSVSLCAWDHPQHNQQPQSLSTVYCTVSIFWSYLMYVWSILSAKLFPERDMSELESYFREFELN